MRNLSHARGIDGINMSRGCPAVSDDSNVEFFQNIPVIERGDRWHNVCHRKSRMAEPRIIVFVKAPRPGFVKTRLAFVIGDEAACKAYRQLTEAVLTTTPRVDRCGYCGRVEKMERVARIELALSAWKAGVIPLYDTRVL